MKYIYIDESGDLGFNFMKRNTSKYFLVTFLITESNRSIEKLVKITHRNLRKKYRIYNSLHAVREEDITITRFCKSIILKDCKVMIMYLEKKKYTDIDSNKHKLYVDIVRKLLNKTLEIEKTETVDIILSRRELNRNLNNILVENLSNYNNEYNINISIRTPEQEKCLQAVDIISWSLFRKYEYGDLSYSSLISKIIRAELPYL